MGGGKGRGRQYHTRDRVVQSRANTEVYVHYSHPFVPSLLNNYVNAELRGMGEGCQSDKVHNEKRKPEPEP